MAIVNLEDLKQIIPQGKQILGIDLGTKTLGLAVSDKGWRLATPLKTIARTKLKKDLATMEEIMAERAIGGFVVGLPLNMDGSSGPRVQASQAFARELVKHFALPVAFWDERLSTQAVERFLISQDVSRQRRGEVIDAQAAQYILQGALDRLGA